jgi:predicted  nucleic acid-binding Zn-ribbon protein
MKGGWFSYESRYISNLPIHPIDFSIAEDKAAHDHMVAIVDRIQDLNKQLANAKAPDDKTRLERQIKATDNQINQLVYELYRLTEDEIKIVEVSV